MRRVTLLLWCGLAAVCSQGPDGILYSSLGESVLLPCEEKPRLPPPLLQPSRSAQPDPGQEPKRLPTQWHFLAPSGEMHPLGAWHPSGKVFQPSGTRQRRVTMYTNASLQVQRLQLGDAGRYVCFQSDGLGNTSFIQNVTLIITGPDIVWSPGPAYGMYLTLGVLIGGKILILILVLVTVCVAVLGRKKHSTTYVNVNE